MVLLSLAGFCNDVAKQLLLMGALPLYLVSVLDTPPVVVGLIEGLAEGMASLLQPIVGWWSDRLGRRRVFVLAGYALSNATKPLLYFAGAWWQVLVIRVTDRAGKGFRTSPRDALIAEDTTPADRGRSFGLRHALDPAGATVSLLAGALIILLSQDAAAPLQAGTFRNLVLFIVLPGLATLPLVVMVRERRPAGHAATPAAAPAASSTPGLGGPYWHFLGVAVLFALGNSGNAFLILRARQLGANLVHLFLVLAGFNLMSALFSLPAGWLSDRFGRKRFLVVGWVLYAGVYAGFGFARDDGQVLALLLLYGVYYGITEGVSRAMVGDLVAGPRCGAAYGLLSAAQGVCILLASLLAGWLWTAVGPAAPFLAGAVLGLLAAVGLLTVRPDRKLSGGGA